MTRTLLVVLALTLLSAGAHAQERSRPGAGSVLTLVVPDRAAATRIRAEARARLLDAMNGRRDIGIGPAPDVLLEQAIARYDVVLSVFPDDVDAWLERGQALATFRRTMADGHEQTRIAEAIDSYEHARALDPRREEAWLAFELAVLRTRGGDYAGAANEYRRGYDARDRYPAPLTFQPSDRELLTMLSFAPPNAETVLANWAEVTMLSGDASAAIDRYRASLAGAPTPDSTALALWGLALAEERSGSHADALETALRAIDADHSADHATRASLVGRFGAFAILHADGVFFEPACEIHAYESLGHEALAMRASSPEGRAAEWSAARLSARFFLAEGGRASPYVTTATDAEARLSALLSEGP